MKLNAEEYRLKNGLKVYAVRKENLPIFQMNFVVRCGAARDPEDLKGLASLTFDLIESGPKDMNEIEVASAFEREGVVFSTNTAYSYSSIAFKSLSSDFENALKIFKKVIFEPAFRLEDVEREKELTVNSFMIDFSEPAKVAEYVFQEKLYEGHPVGHDVDGSIESVRKIKRDDVIEFYSRCFHVENSFIVVVSDLDDLDFLNKYFGSWETSGWKEENIPGFNREQKMRVVLVNMPVTQSVIRMGFVGVDRKSPDFNALRVADYILGGSGFSSRLVEEVRTKRGYSYAVHSLIDPGFPFKNTVVPGRFSINLETSVEKTNEAIDTVMKVIEKFVEDGITEKELKEAKQYYEGSLPRKLETYSSISATRLYSVLFSLDVNYFLKDLEEIKNLTVQDVNRVIRQFFSLEKFTTIIVTDLSKFKLKSEFFRGVELEEYPYENLLKGAS